MVEWFRVVNGQFTLILTELSARHTSVFSFPDNKLHKYQSVFTKFGMCSDIIEIWFEIANGHISSFFSSHDSGGVLSIHVFIRFLNVSLTLFD